LITTTSGLQKFLSIIQDDTIIAVDTEFLRIHTYYPQPCIIQIATRNGCECIDLLSDIDIQILKTYLYDKGKLLVLHSGRQDIEIFYYLFNALPQRIFDTQICGSFLGYPHQVSYADLVKDTLGVHLEKKYTRFDWSKRPLPDDVISYARNDVIYLLQLYERFKYYQYYDWVLQESKKLLSFKLYHADTTLAYTKVKGISGLGKKYQTTALQLSAYREEQAIQQNKPRKWIFDDQTLFDYATTRVRIPQHIVDNLPQNKTTLKKSKPANSQEKNHIKILQKSILQKALQYNLNPELIACKKDILKFIRGEKSQLNQTWRKEIMSNMNDVKLVDAGNVPECVNVVIEIPANSSPVKYELDKETNALFVDRFMSAPMFYPANYGFVPQTLADDGDPADVLVITPYPLVHNCVIKARPVGVLKMTDDGGVDAKILAVPFGKLSTEYDDIQDIDDVPALLKEQIEHFFTHYKELEKGKWVKIDGWDNAATAKEILVASQQAYQK
jgi:inorganic pyrophosphatase